LGHGLYVFFIGPNVILIKSAVLLLILYVLILLLNCQRPEDDERSLKEQKTIRSSLVKPLTQSVVGARVKHKQYMAPTTSVDRHMMVLLLLVDQHMSLAVVSLFLFLLAARR
jgi:hypothetical protein